MPTVSIVKQTAYSTQLTTTKSAQFHTHKLHLSNASSANESLGLGWFLKFDLSLNIKIFYLPNYKVDFNTYTHTNLSVDKGPWAHQDQVVFPVVAIVWWFPTESSSDVLLALTAMSQSMTSYVLTNKTFNYKSQILFENQ